MKYINKIYLFILGFLGDSITFFYRLFAKLFNYPTNPGMLIPKQDESVNRFFEGSQYPRYFAPISLARFPKQWIEVIFSALPPSSSIPMILYHSNTDGYYNFYINLYSNTYFLPDWLSKWLQLTFNIYLDTTNLEIMQDAIFAFLIMYLQFLAFRINLFWFISINPFNRPWIYITSLVDWAYDLTAGIIPGIVGVDFGILFFFSLVGKLTDIVNYLVFTMPFLPSEGEIGLLEYDPDRIYEVPFGNFFISPVQNPVRLFHNLPRLWYTHPIPEELRQYWFFEEPLILKYMRDNYGQLGINFYPDAILNVLKEKNISIYSLDNFLDNLVIDSLQENFDNVDTLTISNLLSENYFHIHNFDWIQNFKHF